MSPPKQVTETSRSRLMAIGLMCAAVFCFAILDANAKWLTTRTDPMMIVFARYGVGLVVVLMLFNPYTRPGVLRTRRPWLQAGRSLLLLASTALNFIALKYLQLAETVSIMFAVPLIVALMSGPVLGEWPGPRRLVAIGIGFIGVLVITRPGSGAMHPAAFLVVLGCLIFSFYALVTRLLAPYDSPETTLVYSGFAGSLAMAAMLPWIWETPQDPLVWLGLILIGVLSNFGHYLLILAHRLAPASLMAPFLYTQIVWMILFGWLFFGQLPDSWTYAGSAIVIGSGLYLLYRERVRAKPESSARLG